MHSYVFSVILLQVSYQELCHIKKFNYSSSLQNSWQIPKTDWFHIETKYRITLSIMPPALQPVSDLFLPNIAAERGLG